MEAGEMQVMEEKKKVKMKREGNRLFIGKDPQLIVELETQENYIKTGDRLTESHRKVGLSPDLLAGKRGNVLETVVETYYLQACHVAEGIRVAEEYREKRKRRREKKNGFADSYSGY